MIEKDSFILHGRTCVITVFVCMRVNECVGPLPCPVKGALSEK